jgi:hypothetical protein
MRKSSFVEIFGCRLSSVIFVMDYLQLDFDGNVFTLNIWPKINIKNKTITISDRDFRNELCSLITHTVEGFSFVADLYIEIRMNNESKITIPLNPDNPEIVTPEILTYRNTNGELIII